VHKSKIYNRKLYSGSPPKKVFRDPVTNSVDWITKKLSRENCMDILDLYAKFGGD